MTAPHDFQPAPPSSMSKADRDARLMGALPAGLLTAIVMSMLWYLWSELVLSSVIDGLLSDASLREIQIRVRFVGLPMVAAGGFLLHWLVATGDRLYEGLVGAGVWAGAAMLVPLVGFGAQSLGYLDTGRGVFLTLAAMLAAGALQGLTRGPAGMALFSVLGIASELLTAYVYSSIDATRANAYLAGVALSAVSLVASALILVQLEPASFAYRPRRPSNGLAPTPASVPPTPASVPPTDQ